MLQNTKLMMMYIYVCFTVCIGVSILPPKNTTLLFFANPHLKSANNPSLPFLGNSPCTLVLVFHEPSAKNDIFQ